MNYGKIVIVCRPDPEDSEICWPEVVRWTGKTWEKTANLPTTPYSLLTSRGLQFTARPWWPTLGK